MTGPESVDSALQDVHRKVEESAHRLLEILEDRHDGWIEAVAESLEASRAIDPSQPVITYLEAMSTSVVRPLFAVLAGRASAKRATQAWDDARSSLEEAVATVPRSLTRQEPGHLYRPREGDSWLVGIRKSAVRTRRAVAAAARWPLERFGALERPQLLQSVPLRALAAYHMGVWVPRAFSRGVEAALQAHAPSVTLLERAVADWTNQAMEAPDGDQEESVETAHAALTETLARALAVATEAQRPVVPGVPEAATRFEEDVLTSGTFMLNPRRYRPEVLTRVQLPLDRRWEEFYERAANRAALGVDLAQLRTSLLEQMDRFRESVQESVEEIAGVLEEKARVLRALEPPGAGLDLQGLDAIRRGVGAHVDELEAALSRADGVARVAAAADRLADGLAMATRRLPPLIRCQAIQDDERVVSPAPSRRDYRLAELAETAFDALAIDQIRGAAEPMAAACESAVASPAELRTVLEFNLSTAADDLAHEEADPKAVLELVRGGIESAAAVASEAAASLRSAVPDEFLSAAAAMDQAWSRLYSRIRVEDQRQDELLGAWTKIRGWASLQLTGAAAAFRNRRERLTRAWRRMRARALRALRRGRTAVLQPQVTDEEIERTLVAVQEVDRLTRHLPIVYQRLFAMAPVSDPDLTVGRTAAIARVGHLRRRWERSVAPILVVTGRRGVGRTTFLNIVAKRIFDDCTVVRVNLPDRLSDPGALFDAAVSAAYRDAGTEPPSASGAETASDTDVALFSARESFQALAAVGRGRPVVVMVEPLEHLFTRRVGGAQLVESVLTQLRHSPSSVWWILTASTHAWALLEKLEPNAPTLASRLDLAPFDRDELEEVVLKRHRKSGLPLRFEAPPGASRRIQSEARRAPGEADRQAVYRREFFDWLARLSSGDLTLAQFYWLRALELDRQDRVLKVRAQTPLNFAFLADLDLDRAFALKAFLSHGSLTPVEYAQITGETLLRCLVLFESLYGLRLIRPAGSGEPSEPVAVSAAERYRLHPLTAGPVVDYLVAQRIIH